MISYLKNIQVLVIVVLVSLLYPFNAWASNLIGSSIQRSPRHHLKLGAGLFTVFSEDRAGPALEFGYGYEMPIEEKLWFGFDLESGSFFPDSFKDANITILGKETTVRAPFQLLIPIINTKVGMDISEGKTVYIGLVYLWGLQAAYREEMKFNTKYFWEAKFVRWMDRIILGEGLHDSYLTLGAGTYF